MEKLSPEQWQKIEEKTSKAEIAERKKRSAEVELYEETGLTKEEREKLGKEKLLEKEDIAEIVEELESEKEALVQEIKDLLGPEGSPERTLVALQKENLWKSLREDRKIELERKQLLKKESELLQSLSKAQEKGKPARGKSAILEKVRNRLNELKNERENLLQSSPEAYFGLHLKELKEYKKDLGKGRIVETPYVKEQVEDITTHLRVACGQTSNDLRPFGKRKNRTGNAYRQKLHWQRGAGYFRLQAYDTCRTLRASSFGD
jgi:hypothetical protein